MTPGQAAELAEAGVHRLVFVAPQTPDGPGQAIAADIGRIAPNMDTGARCWDLTA